MRDRRRHFYSLGQMTADNSSEGFCLGTTQRWLSNKGLLPVQFATSKWNDQTKYVLTQVLGPGWENLPGGPCALVAVLETKVSSLPPGAMLPGTYPGGYPGAYPTTASMFGGFNLTTGLILGGVALFLYMMLGKK